MPMFVKHSSQILKEMQKQKLGNTLKLAADVKKTFEENFQQLTDAILMEHLPRLRRYDLGFQLVDKSEDNSRGLGIRAFRLRTLGFIPFFYDNGMVGGYEMIYLPEQDVFLPTTEEWTVYLTSNMKKELGEASNKVREYAVIGLPNLLSLRRPLVFKSGSASQKHLVAAVRQHKKLARALIHYCAAAPFLVEKIARFYGIGFLKEALAFAQEPDKVYYARPLSKRIQDEKLQIITEATATRELLSPYELEQLEKVGYIVRDKRTASELSQVIPKHRPIKLFPIDSPGLYQAVTKDGKDVTLLVLRDVVNPDQLIAFNTQQKKYYVFTPSRGIQLRNLGFATKQHQIYAFSKSGDTEFQRALREFYNSFLERSGTDVEPGDILIDASGRAAFITGKPAVTEGNQLDYIKRYQELIVPEHYIRITDYGGVSVIEPDGHSERKNRNSWKMGDPIDFAHNPLEILVREHERNPRISKLTVKFAAPYYVCNGKALEKAEAFAHLMRDWNLSEKQAKVILKDAEMLKRAEYFVKFADDWLGSFEGLLSQHDRPGVLFPPAPEVGFAPGFPAKGKLEVDVWVPGLKRPMPVRSYLDPPEVKHIQIIKQLADSNDGEVFDVSMLAAILHVSDAQHLLEEYVPRLMLALDSLGRLLFIFYRHKDEMQDHYGKEDYTVIVDKLRTNFKNLGELVAQLFQENVDRLFDGLERLQNFEER
ncbi:MAG: hypothetical protein KatS3mg087_0136 [Patescibacteria group bacterium]|nr:MAG: hypothetical protein KatS3mg087_0136 [Patescibacteria group bacterium]